MTRKPALAVVALLLFTLSGGALNWAVGQLIRRPGHGFAPCPADAEATAFVATNTRGLKICAWWWPGKADAGAVLLCHGHSVDHARMVDVMPFLRRTGVSLLALDFSAHGRSEGEFTSVGLLEADDIAAVLTQAEKLALLPASMPLAAFGRSMGAATLINGAAKLPRIGAFILESSFAELRSIVGRDAVRVAGIPDGWPVDRIFDIATRYTGIQYWTNRPIDAIKGIGNRPLLLIHCGRDARVTRDDFNRLVAAAGHPRTLEIASATHVRGYQSDPAVFERAFLETLVIGGIIATAAAGL